MVAAVGVGAYGAAIFHLVTHAFFKALLFLGSGSVIHGDGARASRRGASQRTIEHDEHDEHEEEFDPQDMRNMGGLRHRMPITYWTYVIGTLALAGIFPFAGFWSKDEILARSWLRGLFGDEQQRRRVYRARRAADRGGLHRVLHVAAGRDGLSRRPAHRSSRSRA